MDHGRLEDIKLDSATWKPVRATRWSLDVVRPEFLSLRPGSPKKLLGEGKALCLCHVPPPPAATADVGFVRFL